MSSRSTVVVLLILFVSTIWPRLTPSIAATPAVPVQTDDGLDPISLVWVGFAPAWWVSENFRSWNPTPCSEPKTVNNKTYDFTLETPNTLGQTPPCWGPRFHVRIWDMGYEPEFGWWSIGAVHHEYTQCNPFPLCHHVVDSWEDAESKVRSMFAQGTTTVSISNYTLGNARSYQGVYNDGNATFIRLSRPQSYPVTFVEAGLPQGGSWSVTLNGTTSSSVSDFVTFSEPNGTYQFSLGDLPGYTAHPASGTIFVKGHALTMPVNLTQSEFSITFTQHGLPSGTAWSVALNGTVQTLTTDSISFSRPYGYYSFSVGNVTGYSANPSTGWVLVDGDKNVSVQFNATDRQKSAPALLPSPPYVYGGIVAVILATVFTAFLVLRKRGNRVD